MPDPSDDRSTTERELARALALERARSAQLEEELRRVRASAEKLAQTVEAEEEFLVSTLNKKLEDKQHEVDALANAARAGARSVDAALEERLKRVQDEKVALENALEREQECMMHRLTTVLEELGREKASVSRERDRLSRDLERKSSETMRLKEEKVRLELELENEEEHIVNVLQTQIALLLKRNRSLERQVRSLGGVTSDSEYVSDEPVSSPRRAGAYGSLNARDAFASNPRRRRPGSATASPLMSDRESLSPGRRRMQQSAASNATASTKSLSSEPRSPRTSSG